MIIFPCQITAEQIEFSFEFPLGTIILHSVELFKILEKILKICVPSVPDVQNGDISYCENSGGSRISIGKEDHSSERQVITLLHE